MPTATAPARPTFAAPPSDDNRTGLRLSAGARKRRPGQIGLGVALVLVCAAVAGAVFQSSAKRVSVVAAARELPAGTVLTAGDLSAAMIPASGNITAMTATGSQALVGRQLDTPVFTGSTRSGVGSVP